MEPKLLTEDEVHTLWLHTVQSGTLEEHKVKLRERGLIAQEPVDPLLIEARKQADMWWPKEGALTGSMDDSMWMKRITAALKRGMELAERPTLTRDMVQEAIHTAQERQYGQRGHISDPFLDGAYDSLHAALTEAKP